MAKYKEEVTQVDAVVKEYTRACSVEMLYPVGVIPEVTFQEERIRQIDDNPPKAIEYLGSLKERLTPENANTKFNLLEVDTNVVLGQMTYEEVYGVLYSLYLHLANERDNKL